jgi:D-alanyl-D-alanine carboxypeptidase/D-alanyl-D-alanine-endopeptidase (penicillin-binding protein 4)
MPLTSRVFLCVTLLFLLLAVAEARDRDYLPAEVRQVLSSRQIPRTSLSIYVREVGREQPMVSFNSDVPRNPASTMKVLTTYAALEILGPAYSWQTRAYATGPIEGGTLKGDLVLVGGGDPFMTADRWWSFASGLRQTGISRVAGNVVIDNSYFAPQGEDRSLFDNRPYRTYNVLPDALLVNFQTVALNMVPDAASGTVRASVNPWPANLTVDNHIRLSRGACRRGSGTVVIGMPDGPNGRQINLSGQYASGCGQLSVNRAVMRAPEFAYGTFRAFWQQAGGVIDGDLRVGTVPGDARLLYTHESLTLAEVIRLVNKFSSNVMARQLFLTLAAEKVGVPATAAGGQQVLKEFLAGKNISIPGLVVENGSGLSRNSRITAVGLAEILEAAHRSQYMPEFAASLPLSATDGTLRKRFQAPEMQGRLRMKTGSLEDVSALAGFVNSASGRTFVAVVILNHSTADEGGGAAVQAALVSWLFAQ